MAGQMSDNLLLNTVDFSIAYLLVLLGRCAILSVFLFSLILLLRGTLLRKAVFMRGMAWGLLLVTPFLGKLRFLHENSALRSLLAKWDILCINYPLGRYSYLLGMVVCTGFLAYGQKGLQRLVRQMEQDEVCGQKVWINELEVTPFTTGLFRPRIVLPRVLQEEMDSEEMEIILLHEKTHIRLGHLLYYRLWDILQILLWPNVLFILCRRYFQEDLEAVCDRITIQKSGRTAYTYGLLLLKSMRFLEQNPKKGIPSAFAKENGYRDIRQRFSGIADFKPFHEGKTKLLCAGSAVLLAGLLLLIAHSSYPCYTEDRSAALLRPGQETEAIVLASEEIEEALSWDEEYIYIHRKPMDQLLAKYGIRDERFWIGMGGFWKIPLMGSGGGSANVDYSGQEEELVIPYWNSEKNFWIAFVKQMP